MGIGEGRGKGGGMACVPKVMLLRHLLFWGGSMGTLAERAYEWWGTPVVIPARRAVWCVWRWGTWWKRIGYGDILKISALHWQAEEHLQLHLRDGKSVDLGTLYLPRELGKIRGEILRRLAERADWGEWEKVQAGDYAEVWRKK